NSTGQDSKRLVLVAPLPVPRLQRPKSKGKTLAGCSPDTLSTDRSHLPVRRSGWAPGTVVVPQSAGPGGARCGRSRYGTARLRWAAEPQIRCLRNPADGGWFHFPTEDYWS